MSFIGLWGLAIALLVMGIVAIRDARFAISKSFILVGQRGRLAGAIVLCIAILLGGYGWALFARVYFPWAEKNAAKQRVIKAREDEKNRLVRKEANTALLEGGLRLMIQGDFEKAVPMLEIVTSRIPNAESLIWLAQCRCMIGEFKKAILNCDEGLRFCEDSPAYAAQLYTLRGYANYRLRQFAAANKDFTSAIRISGDAYDPHVAYGFRGWIAATCNEPRLIDGRSAVKDAEFLLNELTPRLNWERHDEIAAMYARGEDFAQAVNFMEHAISELEDAELNISKEERVQLLQALEERKSLYANRQGYTDKMSNRRLYYPRPHGWMFDE